MAFGNVSVEFTSDELTVLQDVLDRLRQGVPVDILIFLSRPEYGTATEKIIAAAWESYGLETVTTSPS